MREQRREYGFALSDKRDLLVDDARVRAIGKLGWPSLQRKSHTGF